MKVLGLFLLIIAILAAGFWSYRNFVEVELSKYSNVSFPREKIDPSTFTREEALKQLELSERNSDFTFATTSEKTSLTFQKLPERILLFVVPLPKEGGTVEYYPATETYYVHYFSELALPEAHEQLLRKAVPANGYPNAYWVKGSLISSIDIYSPDYEMRISQLAVSETRTEVFIYAKKKR